jgi:hypothetical protein
MCELNTAISDGVSCYLAAQLCGAVAPCHSSTSTDSALCAQLCDKAAIKQV